VSYRGTLQGREKGCEKEINIQGFYSKQQRNKRGGDSIKNDYTGLLQERSVEEVWQPMKRGVPGKKGRSKLERIGDFRRGIWLECMEREF